MNRLTPALKHPSGFTGRPVCHGLATSFLGLGAGAQAAALGEDSPSLASRLLCWVPVLELPGDSAALAGAAGRSLLEEGTLLPRGWPESRLMLPPEPPQPVLLLTSSSPHLIQRPHPAVRPPPAVLCVALASPMDAC